MDSSIAMELVSSIESSESPTVATPKGKAKKVREVKPPSAHVLGLSHFKFPGYAFTATVDTHEEMSFELGAYDFFVSVKAKAKSDRTLIKKLKENARMNPEVIESPFYNAAKDCAEWRNLEAAPLISALQWVSLAMSTDETRYNLNGVFFAQTGEIVASDGHRLHMVESMPVLFPKGRIVPAFLIKSLLAAAKWTKAEQIQFAHIGVDHVAFRLSTEGAEVLFCARLVDGLFLDYGQVIPNVNALQRVAYRSYCGESRAIKAAIKLAPKWDTDKANTMKFRLTDIVSVVSREKAATLFELPISGPYYSEKAIDLALNHKYLTEAVEAGNFVDLHFADDLSPVVIKCGERLAVVMPIRA